MQGLEVAVGRPTVTACTVAAARGAGSGSRRGRGVNDPSSDEHTRLWEVPARYRYRVLLP